MVTSRQSKTKSSISYATVSTTNSAYTDTSTIWGPGTLAGKALEAFGEATLRGIESIVIRRKLGALRSAFPHTDNSPGKDIDSVYDAVLELSRVGLYSQNVSSAAMQLITTQIASRETHHLRMALQRWPLVELRLFMSQLMSTYMHDYEILQSASTGTAADQDGSAFIPIVDFIVLIAEQDDSTCQAVLDGGFLDLLLGIYTSCPILDSGGNRGPFTTLVSSCTSTLLILSKGSTNIESIIDHPVCTIWTQCGQLFHTPTTEDFISRRCTAWRRTDKSPVLRRVVTIYKVLLSMRNLNEPSATEIYNDLVEFSRSQFYDPTIKELAILAIFKSIIHNGNRAQALFSVFATASHPDVAHIWSRIILLWIEFVQTRDRVEMPQQTGILQVAHTANRPAKKIENSFLAPSLLYNNEKSLLFRKIEVIQRRVLPLNDRPLHHILEFIAATAQHSMTVRWGLLDAGILALVLVAFVDGVPSLLCGVLNAWKPQQLRHDPNQSPAYGVNMTPPDTNTMPISLDLINAEASKLLLLCQAPPVQALFQSEIFTKRRKLCSSLVDILLGHSHGWDDTYAETRYFITQIFTQMDTPLSEVDFEQSRSLIGYPHWQPFLASELHDQGPL